MKRRTLAIVGCVMLVALCMVILLEPTRTVIGRIGGDSFLANRPSRYWAAQLQSDARARASALEMFEKSGPQAIPVLAEIYSKSSGETQSEARWTALEILAKQIPLPALGQAAIVKALHDPDPHVQSVAVAAVAKSGVLAADAVPVLTRLLASENSVVAARALSEYRASAATALPELIAAMRNEKLSTEARWNAVRTIGKIGPDAVSSVPDLIDELDNPEQTIREHAAEAIGDIGPVAAELGVPALRQALTDRYVKVRRDAVRSLGYIGAAARPAAEDMKLLLKDHEAIVREAAAQALKIVAPELLPPAEPKPAEKTEKPQPEKKPSGS